MVELFQKEGHSIFTFKKGDVIIRLRPRFMMASVFNENLGISTEIQLGSDHSFREPVEFICVENNLIYLMELKNSAYESSRTVYSAYLEEYSEDWALFVIPEGLTIDDCLN